jgi:hypothetical protein
MIESGFDEAVDLVVSGPGSHVLRHLLEAAQDLTRAPVAYVIVRRDAELQIVATSGLSGFPFGLRLPAPPGISKIFAGPAIWEDLTGDPVMARMDMVDRPGGWRWFSTVPIPLRTLRYDVALCCADPRLNVERRSDLLQRLNHVAIAIADMFGLLALSATATDRPSVIESVAVHGVRSPDAVPMIYPQSEPGGVTERFLMSTLINQHRVLRRDSITYHALARWRASIRDWQIEALRALKSDPPASLVDRAASQIATTASGMFGFETYRLVVPVACGNSGANCLASRLARVVADKLGVSFMEAFEAIPTQGSSHPRRNATRPRMKLRQSPTQPLLLIDDVATSGAHLEEAVTLLRKAAPAVVPLVWIAA